MNKRREERGGKWAKKLKKKVFFNICSSLCVLKLGTQNINEIREQQVVKIDDLRVDICYNIAFK